MADKKLIKKSSLNELFKKIKAGGSNILAPVEKGGRVLFENVSSFDETAKDYVQTTTSAKQAVFPSYEKILSYRNEERDVKIDNNIEPPAPSVVFGLRPCDAKSFATLNAVFMWDYIDDFFKARMDKTTLITVSCVKSDPYCFCTSVGGGPGDPAGSDILLTPIDSETYLTEIFTDKGKAIVSLAPELFHEAGSEERGKYLADVKKQFDVNNVIKKTAEVFDTDIWLTQSMRCISCGACAYVCPACSCFDMQDEFSGGEGARHRCWDSCGFALFTLHTSGHNPRPTTYQRWRQRVMHKFSYQPDRQKVLGCVGCGRCSRACPVDMNILEHLIEINGVK